MVGRRRIAPRLVSCDGCAYNDGVNESATLSRAYRVRLRPKPAQARALNRLFGARRLVWNWALRRKDEAYRRHG